MKHSSRSIFVVVALCVGTLLVTPLQAKEAPAAPPSNGDLDLARRLESAFVKVADSVNPSVVVITSTHKFNKEDAASALEDEDTLKQFEGTPFEDFLRKHGAPQPRDVDSQGSGVIYRADGFIVTNGHVVDGADKIKVRLEDGKELDAEVVGTDDRTDVAVIKVKSTTLPAARFADSDAVKVGQWAIAIGTPFELDYSFTTGVISAKGRSAIWSRGGSAYEDYLQTDASINPGNSGGPLCDIEGRVVGINTLIRGLNVGIGFAIPSNMVKDIADQLIAKGKVIRPWLGVSIQSLSDNEALAAMTKDVKEGVVIGEIHPDTPAAKSELKRDDIVVAVDNVAVKSPRDLQRQILRKQVGQKVMLDVVRDGKKIQVAIQTGQMPERVVVAARPRAPQPKPVVSAFGITVQTLTKDLASTLHLDASEGVVITDVATDSVAAEKGLKHGDLITEVDRKAVTSVDEFKKAVDAGDTKKGVLVYYKHGDAATFVVLRDK